MFIFFILFELIPPSATVKHLACFVNKLNFDTPR